MQRQIGRYSIKTNHIVERLPLNCITLSWIAMHNGKRTATEVHDDLKAGYAVYTAFSFFMLESAR